MVEVRFAPRTHKTQVFSTNRSGNRMDVINLRIEINSEQLQQKGIFSICTKQYLLITRDAH